MKMCVQYLETIAAKGESATEHSIVFAVVNGTPPTLMRKI